MFWNHTTINWINTLLKMKSTETCLILGNGPSLKSVSNELLDKFYTFGTNGIYDKYIPTFYVCINIFEAQRRRDYFPKHSIRFITEMISSEEEFPLHSGWCDEEFSLEPWNFVVEGNTVTFVCLQLALSFGFKNVFLLGVDHRYKNCKDPHKIVRWTGEDPNHFSPNYLHEGDLWNEPDLIGSERYYTIAKTIYERYNCTITNLTENSALDVFPKNDIKILEDLC